MLDPQSQTLLYHTLCLSDALSVLTNYSQAILAAGIGSFVFGYANNVIAGTLVQTSFTEKFLSGDNASSIVGGVLGA
jgi:hypothetical protein